MNRIKCWKCNLVNTAADGNCRRCGNDLASQPNVVYARQSNYEAPPSSSPSSNPRSPLAYVIIVAVSMSIGYFGYRTLLVSDELDRQKTDEAIRTESQRNIQEMERNKPKKSQAELQQEYEKIKADDTLRRYERR